MTELQWTQPERNPHPARKPEFANAEKVRIGMVLDQPFPPDARVEREATALVAAGYEVHLLCMVNPDNENQCQPEEYYRGIYIHRVNPDEVSIAIPFTNKITRLPYTGIIKNVSRFLWNIDNAWYTLVQRFVESYNVNVLHIHDLRLVNTGLAVATRYDIPLVADLHENYPALMEMLKGKHDPQKAQKQREKWENIELTCLQDADRVITVIEESRERLLHKGGDPRRIIVLPNAVDAEKFLSAPVDPEVTRRYKPDFLLTYVGHVNNDHRGIQTVLEAMALLKDDIPELRFVAAGAINEAYKARLDALIERYHLTHRVDFTGWLDETQFVSYIDAADICLCPHLRTDHTDSTFPNKVYLYNLLGKPVVASNCTPLKRYIDETGGGVVFEAANAQTLANQILELYRDTDKRRTLGETGRQAVLDRHQWQTVAPWLIDLYDKLLSPYPHLKIPTMESEVLSNR